MQKWLLGGLIFLCITGPGFGEIKTFCELWQNAAYYDTNLESKNFASLLGRFEGKIGIYLLDTPLQLYGVYYGTASQSSDYWDNSLYSGAGVHLKPFESFESSSWQTQWIRDVKIFYEQLTASYLLGGASAEAAKLAKTDQRIGFDLWHEWNLDKPDENLPWGELWANLSYRDTNFGWEDFKNYIFYFQPKLGRHLGRGLAAYLRADLVASGKSGASYSFLNAADYGAGLRLEPWRSSEGTSDFLKNLKLFAEVLGVSYLKDSPADPAKNVTRDIRFGIDFSYGR